MFVLVDTNNLISGFSTESGVYEITKEDKKYFKFGDDVISAIKLKMLNDVKKEYQSKINIVKENYAPYELESFADQRTEWKAWKTDNTAPTPIVDALASARGITKDELMTKIEANVLYITSLQGQQNALEDKIKASTTIEELKAIVI